MIVCDRCLNVHVPAQKYLVALSKPNADGEKARHARVEEATIEICQSCEAEVWKLVTAALANIRPAPATEVK